MSDLDYRVVLFGTHPLAELIFWRLLSHQIPFAAVVTVKDGLGWWGKTNIAEIANRFGIPVYEIHTELPKHRYWLGLVVQYHHVLDLDTVHAFSYMLEVHIGELPRYRGTNPLAHAIFNARKDQYWFTGAALLHHD